MVIKAPTLPMLAKGQDFLTCRVADLAKDYDGSRNFPAPFYKASQRLCLKNGWHLGSFLLSMQNNIAYCKHRCTKLTPEVAKSERSFEEAPIFERVATSADQNDEELQWPKRGITSKKLRREQVEQAIVDELPDLSSGWTVAELMRAIEKSLELRAEELTKHKGLIEAILDRRQHQELEDAIGLCMDTAEEEGNSLRGVHDDQFLAAWQHCGLTSTSPLLPFPSAQKKRCRFGSSARRPWRQPFLRWWQPTMSMRFRLPLWLSWAAPLLRGSRRIMPLLST